MVDLAALDAVLLADYLGPQLEAGATAGTCVRHRRFWLARPASAFLAVFFDVEPGVLVDVMPCEGCAAAGMVTPID